MVAKVILRKDKNAPLTWDEMDANFVSLRDTPGPQGPQGIQGPPGQPGPAADASVSALLSIDSFVLTADGNGVVPSAAYTNCKTSMQIILGVLDDTANWTFTKTDSAGVTSSISGSTVTLTHINDTTDVGTVTIVAKRPGGYPDLTRVFSISKAMAGDAGPAGTAGPAADASVSAVLSSEAYVFPASVTGVIAAGDYAAATTTMSVVLGLVDDSSNWTFSKTDSTGVISTITGNVVQINSLADNMLTGSVTIYARRTGYPTLKRVFDLSKAKAGPIGADGQPGPMGPTGPTGSSGLPGVRGSRTFYVAVTTSTWSDATASTAASVSAGPVLNDTVMQYNSSTGFSATKFWTGSSWATVNVIVNGNMLVDGTVGAQKLIANTITANSGVIAQAAIGTLTLAGNAVTQAVAVNQIGVVDNSTSAVGSQMNIVPTASNNGVITDTGWTTVSKLSNVTITGTQPVMVWGSANCLGLHAYGTGAPANTSSDATQNQETYAGFTWVYNVRPTWFNSQVVFVHSDGTKYFAYLGDDILHPGEPHQVALTAFLPNLKAGVYEIRVQYKVDTVPSWTTAGTPIEGCAVRQTKLIVLETKR